MEEGPRREPGGDLAPFPLEITHLEKRVEEAFVLSAEGYEGHLDLHLAEVVPLGEKIGVGERDAPFTVRFRGPTRPRLPQRTYILDHPDLGRHEVFLVPIAEDAEGRTYEAVFT